MELNKITPKNSSTEGQGKDSKNLNNRNVDQAKNRTRSLVLADAEGQVIRYFNWNGEAAHVVQRKDNRRLELVVNLDLLEDKKIEYIPFGKVAGDNFESLDSKKLNQLNVGRFGHLSLVNHVENNMVNEKLSENKNKLWMLVLLLIMFCFLIGSYLMQFVPKTTAGIEKELQQSVVKIVKNIQKTVPVSKTQVLKTEEVKKENQVTKVSPTKIAGLKRMGALSVLGSLKSGKNKGGLDISAAQSSAGAGMGGGTQGSGGVQTSLYAKGITSAALGAGNNVNGAGGYGTKGKGGGQAGYGKMALMGATGAKTTQLGNEASVAVGLDRDQIAAVINRNQGQITYCYEQGLKDTPGIAGRVAIAFVIGGNGSVKSAQVDSTSLNAKQVEDCMVMRLKTWKFPVPEGGVDVQVKYPFKLERAG